MIEQLLKEFGRDVSAIAPQLRAFAAEQAVRLAMLAGQPGYMEAVKASAQLVAMKAGLLAIDAADSGDQQARAAIIGFLVGASR